MTLKLFEAARVVLTSCVDVLALAVLSLRIETTDDAQVRGGKRAVKQRQLIPL